jgi:tRNA pseudouridine55 synthase
MHNPSGFILVDKPAGITSFGVVARVRRILSEAAGKKVKVGHTGTLDPFATGLMIIVVGDYCKRAGEFSKLDKSYEATVRLGEVSTTGDPEGDIEPVADRQPTKEDLEVALATFRGTITQRPPMYSAIKIDGQRAYKLAREGKSVEVPERTVTIYNLDVSKYTYPDLHISCRVSSGTYIRTLAEDIGKALGTGAYTVALRRTTVGEYDLKDAQSLDEIMQDVPVLLSGRD